MTVLSDWPELPKDKWELFQRMAVADYRIISHLERAEGQGLHPDVLDKFRRSMFEEDSELKDTLLLEMLADYLEWWLEGVE